MAEFCVAAIQGAKLMDQLGSRSGGWKNVNGCTKAKNIAVQNFEENLISEDGKENLLKNCLFDDNPSVVQAVVQDCPTVNHVEKSMELRVFRVEEEPVDAHATEQDPMQKKKNKRKNVRFDDEPPDVCYIEYPEEGLCVCHDTDVEPYWWSPRDREAASRAKAFEGYWSNSSAYRWAIDETEWYAALDRHERMNKK